MAAGAPDFSWFLTTTRAKRLPGFLGGGRRKFETMFAAAASDQLELLAGWMRDGKIRAVVDQRFAFEQAPEAMEKLKTGRARGKIVIDVAST